MQLAPQFQQLAPQMPQLAPQMPQLMPQKPQLAPQVLQLAPHCHRQPLVEEGLQLLLQQSCWLWPVLTRVEHVVNQVSA